jgi:sugar/nucleoside kinase (ribokinase family)
MTIKTVDITPEGDTLMKALSKANENGRGTVFSFGLSFKGPLTQSADSLERVMMYMRFTGYCWR